jgi:endonuclease/exonuclease/phosphatase family metal-dependent hydrolase
MDALLKAILEPSAQNQEVVLASAVVNELPAGDSLKAMSFNLWISEMTTERMESVRQTIISYMPDTIGVQEGDPEWMIYLDTVLGSVYDYVGFGSDGGSDGEHSAIFYRTDLFTCIASGTKWLSATPDKAGSKYSYTEGGTTYTANYARIMTYVVLERKSDGARFIYVNAHLDNNGNNSGTVAEKIRKGEVEILLGEIQKLYNTHGNLPTVVTGDFNTQPETDSYKTMIQSGFVDSSKVAKQSEIKRTFNGNSDSGNVIFDYIFVSSDLANIVQTYKVCPEKRDGKWISDHNAIIANIVIPTAQTK